MLYGCIWSDVSDGDLEGGLELQTGGIRGAMGNGIKKYVGWYKDLPRVRKLTVPRGTVWSGVGQNRSQVQWSKVSELCFLR